MMWQNNNTIKHDTSCNTILHNININATSNGCLLHNYTIAQTCNCLLKLNTNKILFIAFIGDSTMQQIYTTVTLLLKSKYPKQTSENTFVVGKGKKIVTKCELIRFDSSGQKIIKYLQKWNTNFEIKSPDILFIGYNYHAAVNNPNTDGLLLHRYEVETIRNMLLLHAHTTKIIWIPAGPINIERIKLGRHGNTWKKLLALKNPQSIITDYNKVAYKALNGSGIPFFTSIATVKQRFLNKTKSNDGFHMGSENLQVVMRLISNYLCNQFYYHNDETCCVNGG